jgi:hypothetical protein
VYLRIETLMNLGNLCHPALALSMLQGENLFVRPVKIIGNVGYLLVEPL